MSVKTQWGEWKGKEEHVSSERTGALRHVAAGWPDAVTPLPRSHQAIGLSHTCVFLSCVCREAARLAELNKPKPVPVKVGGSRKKPGQQALPLSNMLTLSKPRCQQWFYPKPSMPA